MMNRQVQLASRPGPDGPSPDNFALREVAMPVPGAGEVLLKTLYLSLDPYMRARMYAGANYTAGVDIGAPMVGATIARVVESRNPAFETGTLVVSDSGWQDFALSDGGGLQIIDPELAPVTTALGVLGMPGQTGYTALMVHGRPKSGETVVVSAATGPVGSVVGQTARLTGARAVGIAGGAEKCRFLVDELCFDAAADHRAPDFARQLARACPDGIDVYFDNVGGPVFETVLPLLNTGARVPVCGTISVNRDAPGPKAGAPMQELLSATLVKQLRISGFIYSNDDLVALVPEFRDRVGGWVRDGTLRYREDIVEGLENAPKAFLGLFAGENFGKLMVRVAQE